MPPGLTKGSMHRRAAEPAAASAPAKIPSAVFGGYVQNPVSRVLLAVVRADGAMVRGCDRTRGAMEGWRGTPKFFATLPEPLGGNTLPQEGLL